MESLTHLYKTEYDKHFFTVSGFLGAMYNPQRYEATSAKNTNGMIVLKDNKDIVGFLNLVNSLNTRVFDDTSPLRAERKREEFTNYYSNSGFDRIHQMVLAHNSIMAEHAKEDGQIHAQTYSYTQFGHEKMSLIITNIEHDLFHYILKLASSRNGILQMTTSFKSDYTPYSIYTHLMIKSSRSTMTNSDSGKLYIFAVPLSIVESLMGDSKDYGRRGREHIPWHIIDGVNFKADVFTFSGDTYTYGIFDISHPSIGVIDLYPTTNGLVLSDMTLGDYLVGLRSERLYHVTHPLLGIRRGLKINFRADPCTIFNDMKGNE